jgi:MFS transporter, DHA3 family, macrolide efflux protein
MAEPSLALTRATLPEPTARRPRLWTASFALLWQGQFVSSLGDVAYEIALGFWVLAATGSTALMGTLMAASTIPRVLVSPFAGVWVDRTDRKRLLVLMDVLRGVAVVAVGVAALAGFLQVWMVFAAGIVIGLGAAFFNPAIGSVTPDIVDREDIVRANSFFSMIGTGSGILGNSVGGYLYAALGAPVMFLVNGISYLVSSASLLFVKVPQIIRPVANASYWADLREGVRYSWERAGLRNLFLMAGIVNFLAVTAIVLILPLFQRSIVLGPGSYGVAMAVLSGGMLLGMALTAAAKVKPGSRLVLLAAGVIATSICWALFPLWERMPLMLILLAVGGAANAVVNVMIGAVLQLTVPQHMRGKVMGFLNTISQGLTPIAMALGGVLGEFLPLKWVIFTCFAAMLVVSLPLLGSADFRRFITYDPEREAAATVSAPIG